MAQPKTPTQQISGIQRNAEKYSLKHYSEAQTFKRANRSAESPAGYVRDSKGSSPFSTPMKPFKEPK